jgi:UDP-2,4-diacetamido-2,4,6-trideoxy-beta-L-altropyranose hydrolase
MTGENPLLIRADATASMGTGHAMRCLALAQAWQDAGGRCTFAMAEVTPAVRRKIEAEKCEVVAVQAKAGSEDDAAQFVQLAREEIATRVVVDGYQFGADYQRAMKAAGLRTLFIDDYGHASHYSADLVLNQNVSPDEQLYANRESYTQLLLGPRYALLRREFSSWRDYKREIPSNGRKVLITLGGSDPEGLTARAIEAVAAIDMDALEAMVVVGGSNPQFEQLRSLAVKLAGRRNVGIEVQRDVANMAELMAWADVAISAGGTTCWELCLLALPALLIDVAENQRRVVRELQQVHCAVHLGSAREVSADQLSRELEKALRSQELRQDLATRARELVDGNGAPRVVAALLNGNGLRLRPVQESDRRLLFEWANDPDVRAAALSIGAISWEQHVQWFAAKMIDRGCLILIAEDEFGQPVGQFRVDWRSSQDAEIDVSVSRSYRGEKYGSKIIRLGAAAALAANGAGGVRLHAFVKPDNFPSLRAFEAAGFQSLGEKDVSGHRLIHYVCAKGRSRL